MANYRVQIVGQPLGTDPGRDFITNVLHYAAPTTTPAAIGDALKTAFSANTLPYYYFKNIWVKVYDKANPLHSPPVYTTQYSGSGTQTFGPRQVAVCVSFYSGLNIRGQRGRIYIGPWIDAQMHDHVASTQLDALQTLAGALRHPGGADVIHQIWHPKTASWSNVSNYFVNDRWDTMRSRLGKETTRRTVP